MLFYLACRVVAVPEQRNLSVLNLEKGGRGVGSMEPSELSLDPILSGTGSMSVFIAPFKHSIESLLYWSTIDIGKCMGNCTCS